MQEPETEVLLDLPGGSVADGAPAGFVVDIELSEPLPGLDEFRVHAVVSPRGWVVARLFTEPIGLVQVDLTGGVPSGERVMAAIEDACRDRLTPRLAALGLDELPPHGFAPAIASPFLESRRQILETAEHMTVVVCTRERPETLRRALASLAGQVHPSFDVLVVDNAPTTGATEDVVEKMAANLAVRYVMEPRPGLSRARNRALAEINQGLLAWLDDDEVADPYWLAELARGFTEHPRAVAVSGIVLPAELRTPAQLWFEQFGGHSKGRGFVTTEFSPATWALQSPVYPLPAFGVGANMAFRAKALHAIGGFDEALGAGTPTKASEDTKVFTQLLLRGGTTVYQHSALTRHYHREDLAGLSDQLVGYGIGLTAYYTALILENPSILASLVRLAPRVYRDMTGGRLEHPDGDFPTELLSRNVRGMLTGPGRYLRTRWDQRREGRRAQATGTT